MTTYASQSRGSVFGGALLVAGCCVGAGMLALPILTGIAGFFPSLLMFFLVAGFMASTAFLIVEALSWFDTPVHYLTMVGELLGPFARGVCWLTYGFLFYALLVAYTVLSGNHISMLINRGLALDVPNYIGSLFFILLFGGLVYMGTKTVDHFNRVLMYLKILAYLGLIIVGMDYVQGRYLEYMNPSLILVSLPVLVISFGFHNLIPTLSRYLNDTQRVMRTIVLGALIVLVIYLLWQAVALGVIPVGGKDGLVENYRHDVDAAQAIQLKTNSYVLGVFAAGMAFFAILTSFLTQSLSLVHFWSDGLNIPHKRRESIWVCAITMIPPWIFSIFFQNVFFKALNFAGGVCAVILFGVLPVLMVWKGRYGLEKKSHYRLFGGKWSLSFLFIFSLFILLYQISQIFHWNLFPQP
ncbi:MAG: Tyrosine-specific transport protein [Chlamydiia bacterium]|nr:Tyrosine-specific transport protein [Chlamydiia bacterium]